VSPDIIELALQKQRLQLRSAEQRGAMMAAAAQLAPAFAVVDGVRDGFRWLRRHPEWLAGGIVALLVVRPGAVLRLTERSFFAWQIWRKIGEWRASSPVASRFMSLARFRRT
jgi:hypothetical protein